MGQGSTLAAAAPGHGQVALEAKPVALDPGVPGVPGPHGPGVPRVPGPAPLASPPAPLGHGLAPPPPGCSPDPWPGQTIYFGNGD